MPPPRLVCNGLASPADAECHMNCEIYEVIHYVAAPFDVDSNFLSYPAPKSLVQFRPKCNQFICWW